MKNTEDKNKRLKNIYTDYLRPLNGELMRILNLDIDFKDGSNNWLIYNDGTKDRKVLDLTGGYGANLMGHKNSEITSYIKDYLTSFAPNNVQGSLRRNAARLGLQLSELMEDELETGPWITTFSNSGAESVEAALKHSLLAHRTKCDQIHLAIQKATNQAFCFLRENPDHLNDFINALESTYPDLALSSKNQLEEIIKDIEKYNNAIFEKTPAFIALENSFHGKTMGALSVTYNPKYSDGFYLSEGLLKTYFINPMDYNLEDILKSECYQCIFPKTTLNEITLKKFDLYKIAAAIVEPIQGEGGIRNTPQNLLKDLRSFADKFHFHLIFDEIQAGLYRIGTLTSGKMFDVVADTYCFSKALGGGYAKIAATMTQKAKYIKEFGYIHTSTFAEDEFSSAIALKTMEIILRDKENTQYNLLINLLSELQEKYPQVIKEVRGHGLMCAIEFDNEFLDQCLEYKIFKDAGYIGYFFSSAILHNNDIRVSPSLSQTNTLRFEPSLYFDEKECEILKTGLIELLEGIKSHNMEYFFSHVYPDEKIGEATFDHAQSLASKDKKAPITVFLCHMINNAQAKKYLRSLSHISHDVFRKKFAKICHFLEFGDGYKTVLKNNYGQATELIMHPHPITSEEIVKALKSGGEQDLIAKVQKAIEYAKDIGATTVGLGQFTSILSQSGIVLDPMGLNLTTGNAYTTYLVVESTLVAAKEIDINLDEATVACVGAAGNIVSVTSTLMARHCAKLQLFYHTPLNESEKYQKVLTKMFKEILNFKMSSPFIDKFTTIVNKFDYQKDLLNCVEELEKAGVLQLSHDFMDLKDADIIIAGANSAKPIVLPEHISENTLLVDIGVPGNIDKSIEKNITNTKLILGGIAALPKIDGKDQSIGAYAFPLEAGSSYACLAESLFISMAGKKDIRNLGELTANNVLEMGELAKECEFKLGNFKQSISL